MLTVKGSPEDILTMAYGGKAMGQNLAEGGVAEGPSHEEGGIPVAQKGEDQPMAEIEGEERVFSKEDTAMMEQMSMQIIQAKEAGDKQGSEEMAKRLGFAVVQMIAAQEQNQAAQEQQMSARSGGEQQAGQPPSPQEAEAMNEFGPVE